MDGGYAELIKLPVRNFLKLPDGLDHRGKAAEVAVIGDALATPFKVVRYARIEPWETVAIIGAGGGLGIHMIMMARWRGARVIAVERSAEKFAACRNAGADAVVDASGNDVADAVMQATGGFAYLGIGGRLITLGGAGQDFRVSARELLNKEAAVIGSRYATRQEVLDTLSLAARGAFWPLVTEVYPLAEADKVHARLAAGAVTGRAALRIVTV
jgi:propanol-preferring alcohol dehydrogenase